MEKFFKIMTVENGILQDCELTKNKFFYSIGEAESHIEKWYLEEKNMKMELVVAPCYRNDAFGENRKQHYEQQRKRISEKYPEKFPDPTTNIRRAQKMIDVMHTALKDIASEYDLFKSTKNEAAVTQSAKAKKALEKTTEIFYLVENW